MPQILVICTANICRSPLAEALLRQRLHDAGYTDWTVTSAGTWAEYERPPARYSIELAEKQGLDIREHIAKMVTEAMVADADLVLCMTANHQEALQIDFPTHADKIFLFSEMVDRRYDLTDPYGGPFEGYVDMVNEVERLIRVGLPKIVRLAQGDGIKS